jgi:hypothetical protein
MSQLSAILPPDARAQAVAAWEWWLSELRAMLPPALKPRRAKSVCDIHVGGHTLIHHVRGSLGQTLAEERPLEHLDEEAWGQLSRLIEGTRPRLILSHPDVFTTTIELPLAARRRLRAAVALQLPQIAPLDPALLSWNAEILASTDGKIEVLVAMARTSRIEQLSSLFLQRDLGAPAVVALAHPQGRTLVLAPGSGTGAGGGRGRVWIAAAALALSIPFTTIAGAKFLTSIEEGRLEALRQELAPREASEREAVRAEAMRRGLKPLFESPASTATLEAIALAMPENAYARWAEQHPDGTIAFMVDTSDPDAVGAAVAKLPLLAQASVVDMLPAGEGRMQVAYRSRPR